MSDSVGLGWGLRILISNTLLWDAHAADPGNHLRIAGIMKCRTAFSLADIIVVFKIRDLSRKSIQALLPLREQGTKNKPTCL